MDEKHTDEQIQTILFVDDEETILEVACEYFEQKGHQVITARDGKEAARIIKRVRVDCCFTDINMPHMDGLELARKIREHDRTIPVIIMTGYPSMEKSIETMQHGVVDFLIKPIQLDQMDLCLKRVLRERRLFIDNILYKKELEKKKELEAVNRKLVDKNQELENKIEELRILNQIMEWLNQSTKSQEVFHRMVEMAVGITHADESCFYVVNGSMQQPVGIAAFSREKGELGPGLPSSQLPEQLIRQSIDQLKPVLADGDKKAGLPPDIRSFMAVPLAIRSRVFGVLTACVRQSPVRFGQKELDYLSFMTGTAAYSIENLALYENIYKNLLATLDALVQAIEAKDPYTRKHSRQVACIAVDLAREMGCTQEELNILDVAGRLHDIGKIGIRDEVLLKPGRLTAEEFEEIKAHPAIGAEIVRHVGFWDREQSIIRYHHERYNGTGYPDGLKGRAIPFLARVLAVADVYDAMASARVYRGRIIDSEVMAAIGEGAGVLFDPEVVAALEKLHDEGRITHCSEDA